MRAWAATMRLGARKPPCGLTAVGFRAIVPTAPRRWRRIAVAVRPALLGGLFVLGAAFLTGCATQRGPQTGALSLIENPPPAVSSAPLRMTGRSTAIYDVLAAEYAGQSGDAAQALKYYLAALQAEPDPALARRVLEVAAFTGDNTAGLGAAKRWVALAPDDAAAQQAVGMMEARAGDVAGAARHFRRFVVLHGKPYSRGLVLIAISLSQEVDPGVALRVMRSVVADYLGEPYAHYAQGILALHLGASAQALASARRALALNPKFDEAVILEAEAQMALNRTDTGLRTLRQALADRPKSVGLRFAYARLLVQAKHYDNARTEFRRLLKAHPKNVDVLYTLGLLDFELGRNAEARRAFQHLVGSGQHAAAAEYFLGRLDERAGDTQAAVDHYSNVNGGQYQFDARVRIAYILAAQGDLDQAREYLSRLRASVNDPVHRIDLYLVEGELLEKADDSAEAINIYNVALSRYPGNARLLYARALVAERLGDIGQAEADLSNILQHDPNNVMALNALGYTLADRTNRYEEALGYIQRALAQNPDDPAILDSMGWVQYRLKNYAEAERYLRRAYAKLRDPEVAAHLCEVLFASGKRAEARTILKAALKAYPDNVKLENLKRRFAP